MARRWKSSMSKMFLQILAHWDAYLHFVDYWHRALPHHPMPLVFFVFITDSRQFGVGPRKEFQQIGTDDAKLLIEKML